MVLGSRKLGSKNWTLQETSYKGNVSDAHNGISLGVDGKEYCTFRGIITDTL